MLLIALKRNIFIRQTKVDTARIAHAINSVETFRGCEHSTHWRMRVLRMLLIALKRVVGATIVIDEARIAHAINSVETAFSSSATFFSRARIAHAINSVETGLRMVNCCTNSAYCACY